MKIFRVAILCVIQLQLVNCAALFNSGRNKVAVNSSPAGAEVYVDGNYQGKTPIKLKLDRKDDHVLVLKHQGKKETYQIESSLGAGWIILDVIGGLVPVIVDAATGSWYSLQPKKVSGNFSQ